MSTTTEFINNPTTKKNVLFEIDIGKENTWWKNHSPFVYKVNFEKTYAEITDANMQAGDSIISIAAVGSVKQDQTNLNKLTSIVDVQSNAGSFYFDSSGRTLYVHCTDSNEPQLHTMFMGEVFGYANHPITINGFYYEPRIVNVSSVSEEKDPIYFGRIRYSSFSVTLHNEDGELDNFGENNNVFGNSGRLLVGSDDLTYDDYLQVSSGFLGAVNIGQVDASFNVEDDRKRLSLPLPPNTYDTTTYPDIKDQNANKPIPLGWGTVYKAKVICNNEDATPPVSYSFKICDTTLREIKAIDAVYVNGTAVTPATTDTTTATFTITSASGDYSPRDKVTVDYRGYVDESGDLIENGLDIVKDILVDYGGLLYDNALFDVAQWDSTTLSTYNAAIHIDSNKRIDDVLEMFSESLQTDIFIKFDSRYTAKKFNIAAAPLQVITTEDMLEVNSISYDPTTITSSTIITYNKDYDNDDTTLRIVDTSQEDDIFLVANTKNRVEFETLLTDAGDAQLFSDFVLNVQGVIQKMIPVKTKLQTLELEKGDNIQVPIISRVSGAMGQTKCEIVARVVDLNDFTVTLTCRVYEIIPETIPQSIEYWGSSFWGGTVWSNSNTAEV